MASQPALVRNDWLSMPWALYTGRAGGNEGINAALGHGTSGNQGTFAIQVDWDDVHDAIFELNGSYRFLAGDKALDRKLPKRHPFHDWLYCSRVTAITPTHLLSPSKRRYNAGTWGDWDYAVLSLQFTQPKYPVLSDTTLDRVFPRVEIPSGSGVLYRQEWMRFVEYTWQSGAEVISADAGSFKFAEGTGAGGQPTAGTTLFQSPVSIHLSKPGMLWTWRQVPYYGLYSPTTYRPERLIAAVNTVNSAALLNNPAGTLLFSGFNISLNEAPYPMQLIDVPVGQENAGDDQLWPSVTCDVELHWSYFDPPNLGTYRGHNLVPYRPDPQQRWYLATADGNSASKGIFPESDHRLIFQRCAT